ncbi:hypothetical protein O181_016567 [Austropuccinia psidii MF-1]|uniref:Uncharacterized protein n=1 Tax=Austropuccinia psidii MF-1 TaxID=1389203 RepID=A0A9Q3C5X4_9BASI|nr:hypothetical protein [Austropuccinia psidii MF-1]
MPCEQALQEPTPGLSGTQWSENLFPGKQQAIPFLILAFDLSELTLPPFVEPSQDNEPPIPGPSPYPETHGDLSPCKPENEVAWMHVLEEPLPQPLRYDHISKKVTAKFL